jgi:hypothetical protein
MFRRFLKFKNKTRTKLSYFIIRSKRFHSPRLQSKQNGTFANYFQIFLPVRIVFIFKKKYQNETKTLQIALGVFKYKKHLVVSKKIWKQKLLAQNFLVLIENVLFRSRILFQKRIYSNFFGTKAPKRKLSLLKEHWFDIASRDK